MYVVNINEKPYRDYIRVYCEEDAVMPAELIQALDTLWSHPEGQKKIAQSWDYKGTLDIVYLKQSSANSYLVGRHAIQLHPLDYFKTLNMQGERYSCSLLETLAHEMHHAADPHLNLAIISSYDGLVIKKDDALEWQADGYYQRAMLSVEHAYKKQYLMTMEAALQDADTQHKTIDAIADEKGKEIFAQLQALKQECASERKRMYREHPQVQRYVQNYESPAITFANKIVRETTDPNFVGRIIDYSDSEQDLAPETYDPEQLKSEIALYISEVRRAGGVAHLIKKEEKDFQKEMAAKAAGVLVCLEDTPQHMVAQSGLEGRVSEQNAQERHQEDSPANCR
jgi:hypothetical protein